MVTESPESGRLTGKVALITGGARGQGASEAALFTANGATVFTTDILSDEGKSTAEEVGATFLEHDVTDAAAWAAVIEEIDGVHGRLDVLVNNAGIFQLETMLGTDLELWDRVIAINQTGVFLGMKATAPLMQRTRGGSIINISSIAGLTGTHGSFAYSASKWAIRGMSKSAARELAGDGIRVNSIHPGIINTEMLKSLDAGEGHDHLLSRIPAGRFAEADEVANLALFLASDESAYCTGSEFTIDGGWTA